jgi:hypothetical protein
MIPYSRCEALPQGRTFPVLIKSGQGMFNSSGLEGLNGISEYGFQYGL